MITKIQINSTFGKLLFEFEKEDNSIKETLLEAVKQKADLRYADLCGANLRDANLSGANLRDANLRYADLCGADLRYANLRDANLRCADLRGAELRYADLPDANLSGANLRDANLSRANLCYADLCDADLRDADLRGADLCGVKLRGANSNKRYIQIGCIGSAKRLTTYCFEDDIVLCGCFTGTLLEFEKQVKETHKNNPQYLREYLGFIAYIRGVK